MPMRRAGYANVSWQEKTKLIMNVHFLKIILLLFFLCSVTACSTGSMIAGEQFIGEKIVLNSNSGMTTIFSNPTTTYVLGANGEGVVNLNLPEKLGDEAEWSPDGNWIVYSTLSKEGARAGGNSKIYIMRSDGSSNTLLVDLPYDDYQPTWTRDGTQIAFVNGGQIYILNVECVLEGGECELSPQYLAQGYHPNWSADGKQITYEYKGRIYLSNTDGSGYPRVRIPVPGHYCGTPRWSPNGTWIVFQCGGHIYIMKESGAALKKLTEGTYYPAFDPRWSFDGQKITFKSQSEEFGFGKIVISDGPLVSEGLFSVDIDGSDLKLLSPYDNEFILWYTWVP